MLDIWVYILGQRDRLLFPTVMQKRMYRAFNTVFGKQTTYSFHVMC